MNQHIVICAILLFSPMDWAQPEDHKTPNPLSCVENLTIPRYNPLARQARLTGTITANIWLGTDGSTKVTIEEKAHKPLVEMVRKSIARSVFRPNCRNIAFKILFDFKVSGDPTSSTDYDSISFSYPNHFIIVVRPSPLMVN